MGVLQEVKACVRFLSKTFWIFSLTERWAMVPLLVVLSFVKSDNRYPWAPFSFFLYPNRNAHLASWILTLIVEMHCALSLSRAYRIFSSAFCDGFRYLSAAEHDGVPGHLSLRNLQPRIR